jgi:hypothetical protein
MSADLLRISPASSVTPRLRSSRYHYYAARDKSAGAGELRMLAKLAGQNLNRLLRQQSHVRQPLLLHFQFLCRHDFAKENPAYGTLVATITKESPA